MTDIDTSSVAVLKASIVASKARLAVVGNELNALESVLKDQVEWDRRHALSAACRHWNGLYAAECSALHAFQRKLREHTEGE